MSNSTLQFDDDHMFGPFFGSLGTTFAMTLTAAGAAYGTAHSGTAIAHMATVKPELAMRGLIPVIMAGIVAIYGLVTSVILGGRLESSAGGYTLTRFVCACVCPILCNIYSGFAHMFAGLVCGMCGVASGYAIGITGDCGVRTCVQQPRFFVGMVLILIFAEVLGLYGLIVALVLGSAV